MINKYYNSKEFDNTTMSELSKQPDKYMELINKYTIYPLTENDVFVFPVVLCDNEVDRDGEKFTFDSLNSLKEKFIGKTGIFDHNPTSKNQIMRIVQTSLEKIPNRYTKDGEDYWQLSALVYALNNESNKEFIQNVKGGILKEVSVGCSIESATCSICGEPYQNCDHVSGEYYNNKYACVHLNGANDAYEFSFVAIPAQKDAGVTKNYNQKGCEDKDMNNEKLPTNGFVDEDKIIKSYIKNKFTENEIEFASIDELIKSFNTINRENEVLKEKAKQYDSYKSSLIEEAVANGVKAEGESFNTELFKKAFSTFTCEEIKTMSKNWEVKATEVLKAGKQISQQKDVKFVIDPEIDYEQF